MVSAVVYWWLMEFWLHFCSVMAVVIFVNGGVDETGLCRVLRLVLVRTMIVKVGGLD